MVTKDQLFHTRAIHAGSKHSPTTGAHIAPITVRLLHTSVFRITVGEAQEDENI